MAKKLKIDKSITQLGMQVLGKLKEKHASWGF
jgi:hypothetical protein